MSTRYIYVIAIVGLLGFPAGACETETAHAPAVQNSQSSVSYYHELQHDRYRQAHKYANQYDIRPDLALKIYDASVVYGLDSDMLFELVYEESSFRPQALSGAAARGLMQVRLRTARIFDPDVTPQELYEVDTNLRIGCQYLVELLERYPNKRLALLAYNRGPTRVDEIVTEGRDPSNGYARSILE